MVFVPLVDKFPVDAVVLRKMSGGNSLLAYRDKARFMKKGLIEYYQLKKFKSKFNPPPYNCMAPMNNGKMLIILYEYARGMFVPVEIDNMEVIFEKDPNGNTIIEQVKEKDGTLITRPKVSRVINLKAAEEDMSQWASTFRLRAEDKYKKKNFWDKYGPFMIMAITFVFLLVLTYIFMGAISDSGQKVSDALLQLVRQMAGQPPPG